jgi:pimeloyl-ACP methyl ester carboxylesterase
MRRFDWGGGGTLENPARRLLARPGWLFVMTVPVMLGGCASIVIRDRPVLDRTSLQLRTATTPPPADAMALLQAGAALDRKHPEWAVTYYRDAALRALPQVFSEGVSTRLDIESARGAQSVYRRAIEYLLETAHREASDNGASWTDVLYRAGIGVRGRLSLYDAARCDEVLPTRRFEVKGFRYRHGQGGLGAPVVAHLTRSGSWGEAIPEISGNLTEPCEAHFPRSLYRSAAAVLRPGCGPGEPLAVLELHDPVRQVDMTWRNEPGGPRLPLAYDMTVPLARQFHVANLNLMAALGVLYPSQYDGRTGIYLIDPYEPGKIPVVFVHGLMSSPEAWTNAINDLRGDPELRKRYQFWMFFYSTGNPILASAARFRKALSDVRAGLDPEAADPAYDRMVLIGHSMGGLLSRLAMTSSGQILWNRACKVPPEQIEMEPELRDLLLQALFFEPVPGVSRVVFVSTPHQGSPLGDNVVGQVASRLISVPQDILRIRETLAEYNGQASVSQEFRGARYATSVAQLGLDNPVLQSINQLPMSQSVPFHSIIGYNGSEPLPAGGDGVVPYMSAHVEGALSELVVSSDHSAQETEAAITEMKRILTLHYDEYTLERKALDQGVKPPARVTRPSGRTQIRYALSPPVQPGETSPIAGRFDLSVPRANR